MSDISRRSSVQPDRQDVDARIPPGLSVPRDTEKRRIYEAQLAGSGANVALHSRLTSGNQLHADAVHPGQYRPHPRASASQTSPLRHGFTYATGPTEHGFAQGSSSDRGHAQYASYASVSAHGHGAEDHELMSFLPTLPYPDAANSRHEEVHDSGASTYSHQSHMPPSKDTYTVTRGAPGQITVTLSANMSVDVVETGEHAAFLLSRSRMASLEEVDAANWS